MPRHEVTALVVKHLGTQSDPSVVPAKPAPAAKVVPVAAKEAVPVAAKEAAPAKKAAPAVAKETAKQDWEDDSEDYPEPAERKDDGIAWKGLSEDDWYAGKRLSMGDFSNKVTLVYVWSSKEKASVAMLTRIQEICDSFNGNPLVVVGSHRGGPNPKIPKACEKLGLTFPMYEGLAFCRESPITRYPYIYIVNHKGKFAYRGTNERSATVALVNALTACKLKQ